jgi:hypothetical protein
MILQGEKEAQRRLRERYASVNGISSDLLVRGGQPGLALGEHDTWKKV